MAAPSLSPLLPPVASLNSYGLPDAQSGADCGAERQEAGRQKAERIVKEEVERLGWGEDEMWARCKGHRAKVMLARRLRQETTLSLKWIAQRLQMGSWTYVSNLLKEQPQTHPPAQEVLPWCQ